MANSKNRLLALSKEYHPSPVVAPVGDPISARAALSKPSGGWRNPTAKDLRIISAIATRPGLCPVEYAEITQVYTNEVNDCLYFTRQGRILAENGNVALPARGRRPRWADMVRNQDRLVSRLRDYQGGPKLSLKGGIPADIRSNTRTLDDNIRALVCVVSPKKRAAIKETINDIMHVQALGAAEQRKQITMLQNDIAKLEANLSTAGNTQLLAVASALKGVISTMANEANEKKAISA